MAIKRPNFYIILDLDYTISDWATVKEAITKKRREWSGDKNQGAPAKRRKAEQYLKLIPDMEILFKDAEARKQESNEARKEKNKKNSDNKDELIKLIKEGFNREDEVTSEQLKLLKRLTNFSTNEIITHLKENGFRVQSKPSEQPKREKIDASVANNINNILGIYEYNSLYEFLGHSVNSKSSVLFNHADRKYAELSRTGKTDSETKNEKDLYALAKTVFSSELNKKKYDNSLADRVLSPLNKMLEISAQHGFLQLHVVNNFVTSAGKLGISKEIALDYLNFLASKRKWVIQKTEITKVKKLKVCGFCNAVANSDQDNACGSCGEKLVQPCPVCNKQVDTEYVNCTSCGSYKGDAPYVKSLFKKGEVYLKNGDYSKATDIFTQVLNTWENWGPAQEKIKITAKLKKELDSDLGEVDTLCRQRKFEEAAKKINLIERKGFNFPSSQVKINVDNELKNAYRKHQEGKEFLKIGNSEKAYKKFEEVIAECSDYSPTILSLSSMPPTEPSKLNGKWYGRKLKLSWVKSSDSGELKYQLIRSKDRIPLHEKDGEVIAVTALTEADDTTFKSGVIYYYGVFSLRSGILSKQFTTAGPFLKIPEISNLKIQPGDKQVNFQWDLPDGCERIEIWRKIGRLPSRRGDGSKLVPASNTFLDTGLTNDRRYGYLILTVYVDPEKENNVLYSKGITTLVKPAIPPEPIVDLLATRKGNVVFLSWKPVDFDVHIRMAYSTLSVISGQLFSTVSLDKVGIPIPVSSNGKCQVTLENQGKVHFIPVSVVSDIAVFGNAVSLTMMEDVNDLSVDSSGTSIYLKWGWPKGASKVLVSFSHNEYPKNANDLRSIRKFVTRKEYDLNNNYEISSASDKKYYFTVYVTDSASGLFSDGVNVFQNQGKDIRVNYKIVNNKMAFWKNNEKKILLSCSEDILLNTLLVVFNRSRPPLNINDGMVVLENNDTEIVNKKAYIDLRGADFIESGFVKIFFKNIEDAKLIRLMPASQKFLKV